MLVVLLLCSLMRIFAEYTIYMSWQRVAMSGQYNIHEHFPHRGHSVGVLGTSWEDLGVDPIHTVSGCFL